MAISTNGGSNPTSITYNGKNVTEVWYKSSPSATAVKVWPDGITLKFKLGRFYGLSSSGKWPTLVPKLSICNYDSLYWYKQYEFKSWHREGNTPVADANYDTYSFTFDKDMLDNSGTFFSISYLSTDDAAGGGWGGPLLIDGVVVNAASTGSLNVNYKIYWTPNEGWTAEYYPQGYGPLVKRSLPTLHTIEVYSRDLETGEIIPDEPVNWKQKVNLVTK